MSNVEFDNDNRVYRQQTSFNQQNNNSRGMAGWLLRMGIIKDESQAGLILIVIVIINIAITAWLFYKYVL